MLAEGRAGGGAQQSSNATAVLQTPTTENRGHHTPLIGGGLRSACRRIRRRVTRQRGEVMEALASALRSQAGHFGRPGLELHLGLQGKAKWTTGNGPTS
ncbi:hypothetical protein CVS40_9110 [Lucilia cuprina]|nr:hypothetical protein CVS40_9110 [Lucilia cuprina]